MCVDHNKATLCPPPAKGNFDVYRFDLTKLTPLPQLKFHSCIPSHYTFPAKGNFDDYRFDLTKLTPPPVKISHVHSIMLHLPPAKISQVHFITLHLPPWPKFHRCIPSHYTFPAKGNFDVYRFDLTKLTPPQPKFHRCIPSCYTYPPAKISQMHSITLHQYTNIKCRATQC